MAKRATPASPEATAKPVKSAAAKPPAVKKKPDGAATAPASTPVRKTSIPKTSPVAATTAPAPRSVTHEMIAQHAYYLSQREGGSNDELWFRAERELRDM